MKAIFFACSESSALDMQTNRVSLFHVADAINVVSIPYFINSIAAIAILEKDENEAEINACQLRVTINSNLLSLMDINVDFQGKKRCRTLGLFQGIMIPISGDVTFQILQSEAVIGEWVVKVDLLNLSAASETMGGSQAQSSTQKRVRRKSRGGAASPKTE